ncbi:MAG: efflux RND transporter periplasmic adaptor subunit [Candidatus Competibacteraceae bacterium]|uniref:Efflux transporter, RND family, MFP subunit n=1 Tax=Candidatus Contendobacter odensis Run_B_J11 TaxID=1400861 RepID=A0A7U7GDX0_9GAMM|nr:efflux RND transporter periplasmic adaptor subunit [Candidatus Contendobacter odensis]MBK8535332.1 efflux RND transporter periplasmic adaptor subunit [Candidatus Competibacteraceae bacterium]CDH46449.1 Efflux transporter, RND family, MFP subunit [Candidatus Contendobacter odensis Run_B_J11]
MSIPARPLLLWCLLAVAPGLPVAAEVPFPVAKAQLQTLPSEHVLDGVVEAVNKSTVSAQTAGRVEEIMVDVNDFVPQGAPILRLRNTEQRAGLDQAQASLREAQARFTEAQERTGIDQAQANLREAQARSLEAQAEYNRIRNVYEKQMVSKAQMDTVTATLDAAKARLEAAQAGVAKARDSQRATLDAAKARLDAAQAGVAQARESFSYTTVNAPYSGIVLERHVQPGETVQPGKPLMTGFSLDELRVMAEVPQRLITLVRQYNQARILRPHDGKSIPAEKLTFFPYADPQSNIFKVRIYLPKKTEGLYPGMFVKTAFRVGEEERLTVPRQALAQRGEVSGVYVVREGQVSLRQVRPGRIEGEVIEILAGLEPGEAVALDPIKAGVYLKEQQQRTVEK